MNNPTPISAFDSPLKLGWKNEKLRAILSENQVIAVFLKNYLRTERSLAKSKAEINYTRPPPIAEILCVKNGRAIVVCGFLISQTYTERLKKIVEAFWELPTK